MWIQARILLKFSSRKSIFCECDLDMQQTETKEGHIRIIPTKVGKYSDSSLGEGVL